MSIVRFFSIVTAVFALATVSALASEQTPDQFLRAIYEGYTSDVASSGVIEEDNVRTRRLFVRDLAELIVADYRKMQDMPGEPALEFDPFVNAQDIDVTGPVAIQIMNETSNRAIGVVILVNAGKKEVLTFLLVKIAGQWKIHDIRWNNRQNLRGLFQK